jgi:hypothetical protein
MEKSVSYFRANSQARVNLGLVAATLFDRSASGLAQCRTNQFRTRIIRSCCEEGK